MKLKLLLAFMALSLVSCSDDDSGTVVAEKKLKKIIDTHYSDTGQAIDWATTNFDANNRITTIDYTSGQNGLYYKHEYIYNSNATVATINQYSIYEFAMESPYYIRNLEYDNNGRLIHSDFTMFTNEIPEYATEDYTYNDDNTVSLTGVDYYGNAYQNTDYLNTNGTFSKRVKGSIVTMQVNYLGDNIADCSFPNSLVSYDFDDSNTPKGQYVNRFEIMFGNQYNAFLNGGLIYLTEGRSKYVMSEDYSNDPSLNKAYQYEFDSEGYPVKKKTFSGGEASPSYISEIYYQ